MKRISMSTICSHTQTFPYPLPHRSKQHNIAITVNHQRETSKKIAKQPQQPTCCNLISFQNVIFKHCYQKNKIDNQTDLKSAYHKLRFRSKDKNQKEFIKNQTKSQIQQNSSYEQKKFIPININQRYVGGFQNLKSFSFVDSPHQTDFYSAHEHIKPSGRTTTTLQSYYQLSSNGTKRQEKNTRHDKQNEQIAIKKHKNNRLSTLDSYRIKSNLQETVGSKSPYQDLIPSRQLEKVSKLCQSVKIHSKLVQQNNPYKSQKIIKNKSFIRSLKDCTKNTQQKIHQKLLITTEVYDQNQICYQKPCFQVQNNDQDRKVTSIKTIPPEANKSYFNRINTLAQCGNTIVSRYNRSSQKKSRLSESSIVFQASKVVDDKDFKENKNLLKGIKKDFVVVSDGEIEMRKCKQRDNKDLLNQGSFSERNYQVQSVQLLNEINPIPSNNKPKQIKKPVIKRQQRKNFLRSQRKSVSLRKNIENEEFQEIRFDLDTFIEYGPL